MAASDKMDKKRQKALDGIVQGATVTAACKSAGIARSTWYKWLEDPKFAKAVEEAYDQVTDEIETRLLDRVRTGDTTAIIFALKGRRRQVYGDKREISGPEAGPIQVDVRAKLESQLAAIAERRREAEGNKQ